MEGKREAAGGAGPSHLWRRPEGQAGYTAWLRRRPSGGGWRLRVAQRQGFKETETSTVENADTHKAGETTGASRQEGKETVIAYLGNEASEQQ